jgi:hypothetical protein
MGWRRLGHNDFQAKRGFGLRNYFSDLNKVLSSQNKGLKLFQIDFELYPTKRNSNKSFGNFSNMEFWNLV